MLILGMLIILFDDNNPNYFDHISVYFGCSCQTSLENLASIWAGFKHQSLI